MKAIVAPIFIGALALLVGLLTMRGSSGEGGTGSGQSGERRSASTPAAADADFIREPLKELPPLTGLDPLTGQH